jgi:hypothetical protein
MDNLLLVLKALPVRMLVRFSLTLNMKSKNLGGPESGTLISILSKPSPA